MDAAGPVSQLNELEYVHGEIYAIVWLTDSIVRINPNNGRIVGHIDLSGLMSAEYRRGGDSVLSGMAYDATDSRLFVTGKLWPRLFEVRMVVAA